ncbi:MAG: hypothetical protein RRY20_04595 [Bilophila sp.]
MPDFARWLFAIVSSVVIAGIVFVLATVGIVVAFFVFLVLFVVIGLALRRQRKHGARFGGNGSQFVFYTNIPDGSAQRDAETYRTAEAFRRLANASTPEEPAAPGQPAPRADHAANQTYDLSPDEYSVAAPPDTPSEKKES